MSVFAPVTPVGYDCSFNKRHSASLRSLRLKSAPPSSGIIESSVDSGVNEFENRA